MKIGVTLCVLNEELYIGACLRALISHPAITRIAVVESCCKHNEHAGNDQGLSRDNTAEEIEKVIEIDQKLDQKITYCRYGFSNGKSEVQNYALDMVRNGMDFILSVDGDEIWKYEELDKIVALLESNAEINCVRIRQLNFWKRPDVIRFGGGWDGRFVRVFRNLPGIHWDIHDAPVVLADGQGIQTAGICADPDIYFFHYGYMKPEADVQNKLDFYSKRNGVKISNTYPLLDGEITTDPNATEGFKQFTGEHPREFAAIKFHGKKI